MACLVCFNVIAFNHAHAMLVFTDSGDRTGKPEELTPGEKALVLINGINIPKPINETDPWDYGLGYETYQIHTEDGLTLEGWLIPRKNPIGHILMFHGYAAAKSSLLLEATSLHEMGYAVFMIDFRGSGGSSLDRTSIGYYESNDVAAVARFVEATFGWEDPVFYGQSMGAVSILKAVNDNKIEPDKIMIESVYDETLSTVNNRFETMNIPPFPGSYVLVFWGSMIGRFNGFSHNPVEYAKSINCPVMFMHGDSDPRATLEQAKNVYGQIKTKKRLIVFENAAHESLYLSDPQKWNTEVMGFLENHETP